MYKKWMTGIVLLAISTCVYGDMSRPLFTRENRYPDYEPRDPDIMRPEYKNLEAGLMYVYREFSDESLAGGDASSLALQVRYHILRDLTLTASVPYNTASPASGSSESGIGDITIGADLVAYQDLFRFPYIIPHIAYTVDTGDGDKGLGAGEASTTAGVTIGTVVNEVWGVSVDGSLIMRSDSDNSFMGSLALVRELDKSFSLLGEVRVIETEKTFSGDSYASYFGGGMIYRPMDGLTFGAYGYATGDAAEEDFIFALRSTYQF